MGTDKWPPMMVAGMRAAAGLACSPPERRAHAAPGEEEREQVSDSDAPTYETIGLSVEDGIATITLDREERLNAFTYGMLEDFVDALDRTDADPEVKCVIVTGRGRAFCAGADLGEGKTTFDRGSGVFQMPENADGGGTLSRRIFDSAKPIIGAINGPAVGIGITMTLPMESGWSPTRRKSGSSSPSAASSPRPSSFFLPRIVGISKHANGSTGRIFKPQEALDGGLVRSVHPVDELLPAARELARRCRQFLARRRRADPADALADARRGHAGPRPRGRLRGALLPQGPAQERAGGFHPPSRRKREASYPMPVSEDLPDFYSRWGSERGGFDPGVASGEGDVYCRLRLTGRSVGPNEGDHVGSAQERSVSDV